MEDAAAGGVAALGRVGVQVLQGQHLRRLEAEEAQGGEWHGGVLAPVVHEARGAGKAAEHDLAAVEAAVGRGPGLGLLRRARGGGVHRVAVAQQPRLSGEGHRALGDHLAAVALLAGDRGASVGKELRPPARHLLAWPGVDSPGDPTQLRPHHRLVLGVAVHRRRAEAVAGEVQSPEEAPR